MARTYLESIAYEKAANERAKLDLYASAAHKEMYADARAKAEGWTGDPVTGQSAVSVKEEDANTRAARVTDPRTGAPFQSASDMEAYANEQSRLVFNPVTGANFTSAVDYEIDANRRARDLGFKNAALMENPAAAAPGESIYSDADFVDPRDEIWTGPPERYHIDTANLLKYNPDQPTHVDYDPDWASKYDPITKTYILDKPGAGTTTSSGAAGSMDLISFRPWTQKYWDTYLPDKSNLLSMGKPQKEYGLSYLPGQFRDPRLWNAWEARHGGHIPEGSWETDMWLKPEQMGLGANTGAMQFTSPAMDTNIYANPWSAAQMNLTPEQGAKWRGLLTGLDTAPAVDTSIASLLGVK